jgi:hypothetical protein
MISLNSRLANVSLHTIMTGNGIPLRMGDQTTHSCETMIPSLGISPRKLQLRNLAERQWSTMVQGGALVRRFPEKPTHPEQTYRTIPTPPPAVRASQDQEETP